MDTGLSPYLAAIPAVVLLSIYAIVNGVPFVYPDAFVYIAYGDTAWQRVGTLLEGWFGNATVPAGGGPPAFGTEGASLLPDEPWSPLAGRSIFYSVFVTIPGPFLRPWTGILLQGYCVALAIAFFWRAVVGRIDAIYFVAIAVLGLLTTLGMFSPLAMPDVWAGVGILSLAILLTASPRIGRFDAVVLWTFAVFAALSHSSHLAVLAVVALLCVTGRLTGINSLPWTRVGTLCGSVAVVLALGSASNAIIERAAGAPLVRLPHLTAHLVDDGPGIPFIRDECPGADFAVCDLADDLPVEWRRFLFVTSTTTEALERSLAAQDTRFALATIRHDPIGVLNFALHGAIRQTTMFDLESVPIRGDIGESGVVRKSNDQMAVAVRMGRLFEEGWLYQAISVTNMVLLIGSAIGLAAMACRRGGEEPLRGRGDLVLFVVCGMLLNAAICGILASPYDRFQARVIWLLPLVALALSAVRSREGNENDLE